MSLTSSHLAVVAAMVLVWLLATTTASAQSYDRYAYIKSLPVAPVSPTEEWQCGKWQERSDGIISDVVVAHDACLRVESSKNLGDLPEDTKNTCSKPACQKLHDAASSLKAELTKKVLACRAEVQDVKRKAADAEWAKRERRLRDAQSSPCIREWLQYEALCTGDFESQAAQKRCKKELDDLRRRCPNRGG